MTDYVNIWEKPEHLAGIAITDPIPAVAAALERLRDQVDLTVGIYHGGFERDLATGRVLSATRENVAYRICQELDLDILLTGHQHMSVPGQLVSGTFVVQPSDKGQEFLRVEAAVSGSGKRFSSETVPAHGECRADWLAEFADMERGAQAWLDQVVGHLETPMLPDTPLRMAAEGSALADLFNTVQLAASGAQLSMLNSGMPFSLESSSISSLGFLPLTTTTPTRSSISAVRITCPCTIPVSSRVSDSVKASTSLRRSAAQAFFTLFSPQSFRQVALMIFCISLSFIRPHHFLRLPCRSLTLPCLRKGQRFWFLSTAARQSLSARNSVSP